MSKLFFDHLIVLDDVDKQIKKISNSLEEREELWRLVDEIVYHRVFDVIFGRLPKEHHEEFLLKFHKEPHSESLVTYLQHKISENVEELIKQELGSLSLDILKDIEDINKK